MKKSTLKEQIQEAKKIVASWSQEKRDSVQLESQDIYLERYRENLRQEKELQRTKIK